MNLQHSKAVSSLSLNLPTDISILGNNFSKSSKLVESLNCLIPSFFLREVLAPLLCTEWCYLYNIKELKMTSLTISAKPVRSTTVGQLMSKLIFINVDSYGVAKGNIMFPVVESVLKACNSFSNTNA